MCTYRPSIHAAALAAIFILSTLPASSWATESVSPGHALNFNASDYGTRRCRTGGVTFNACTQSAFVGTGWNLTQRRVRALTLRGGGSLGSALPAAYAEAGLHHEFDLLGAPGAFLNTQFRIDYDLDPGQIAMLGNTYAEVNVLLVIRDITSGSGFNVTSHQLYQLRRDNTQGVTDVSGANERQIKPGESGHVEVMLMAGRRYAASFVLEVMTGALVGAGDAHATASINSLSVWVDEDEVALLDDLAVALEQHDQDIKSRLDRVDRKLDRIDRLLRTPPGRRPGWNKTVAAQTAAPAGQRDALFRTALPAIVLLAASPYWHAIRLLHLLRR